MIRELHIEGYRSVRDLTLNLQPINVLTGPNGCGKSNLYNSLVLIARAAEGRLGRAIGEEGGTPSVFWAGGERVRLQRKRPPKRVILGFENDDFGYELQIGLPSMNEHALGTMFTLDPRVKEEYIWPAETRRRVLMLKRDEPSAWLRDAEGKMVSYPFKILKSESVLLRLSILICTRRYRAFAIRSLPGASTTISAPTANRRCVSLRSAFRQPS